MHAEVLAALDPHLPDVGGVEPWRCQRGCSVGILQRARLVAQAALRARAVAQQHVQPPGRRQLYGLQHREKAYQVFSHPSQTVHGPACPYAMPPTPSAGLLLT